MTRAVQPLYLETEVSFGPIFRLDLPHHEEVDDGIPTSTKQEAT